MKQLLTLLIIIFPAVSGFPQTFTGTLPNNHHCAIRINKDSTINFIYNEQRNEAYAAYTGTIKQLNDTLFTITMRMTIAQFPMKTFSPDTLYITTDSNTAPLLGDIKIEYANKTSKTLHNNSNGSQPTAFFQTPFNQRMYDWKKGTDFITITCNIKNDITGRQVRFGIPYNSSVLFTRGEQETFNVVIAQQQIYTVNNPPRLTGAFRLNSIQH